MTLAAHLVATNIAAAGPLASAWLVGRDLAGIEWSRRLARQSIAALIIAALLGGLLLLSPSAGMRAALARFPQSTYWFAAAELFFSLACMLALVRVCAGTRTRPVWAWILAVATASNLLYHFPPLMTVIGKLAVEPRWAREPLISHRVLLSLSARPEVLSLWLHFVLASLAGAAILGFGHGARPAQENAAAANLASRRFAGVALIATLLQLPVGAWVLLTSSSRAQDAVMGNDAGATLCFAAGVLLAIGLLQTLAAIAAGDLCPAARGRAAGLFLAVALLMAATLTLSRAAKVADASDSTARALPTASFPAP